MLENIRYDQRYASLLAVYRCRSYTLAAEKLSLTPSAVSQQIHSVERELGIRLFKRERKALIPTPVCELVADSVRKVEEVCRRMSDGIDLSRRHIDRLSVGVTPSAGNYALKNMLARAGDASLPTQIKITTGSSEELCDKLGNFTVDVAIIERRCDTNGFNSVMLDTDHLTVAVPQDSEWALKGIITVSELFSAKLIMKPKTSGTRKLFESSLRSVGIQPDRLNVIMEADSTDTIIRLVAGGYGLSVLSNKACAEYVGRGTIASVGLEGINMSRSIRLLYRCGEDMQSIISAIGNYFRAGNDGCAMSDTDII